jgi:nitrile hydratase subunit beta
VRGDRRPAAKRKPVVTRINDVGGMQGFGPIETGDDGAPFHHEWEARVFAINRLMLERGAYTLDEFRYAVERMKPHEYLAASYYERWLRAIETLLVEKGIVDEL